MAIDRVQVTKQESTALGGDDADSSEWGPTPLDPQEDALEARGYFIQDETNRDENVFVSRTGDDMTFKDVANPTPSTLSDLIAGSGGLTPGSHRTEDVLVHAVAEDSHTQVTRTSGKISNITVWADSGETLKIRETIITRSAGKVTTVQTIQYDGAGVAIAGEDYTETLTRVSGKVDSVDGVLV